MLIFDSGAPQKPSELSYLGFSNEEFITIKVILTFLLRLHKSSRYEVFLKLHINVIDDL
jgi:hypothetical protein